MRRWLVVLLSGQVILLLIPLLSEIRLTVLLTLGVVLAGIAVTGILVTHIFPFVV